MSKQKPFKLGVVEGFFGMPWSWQARSAYANFLFNNNFQAYLYAPKNDQYLRKAWQQPFPDAHKQDLLALSKLYSSVGIDFGIGLSPFELYRDFNTSTQAALKTKLQEINLINPATLCILFDDMRGNVPDLAQQQIDILDFIREHSNARNLSMCPTYYSTDPALSQYFGEAPPQYLEQLGQGLDPLIDIFWTGPHVCSNEYPRAHMTIITEKLNRKPMIWDNYPVNDSKRLAPYLHLRAIDNRGPQLKELACAHFANPMNQAFLSQFALVCLSLQINGSQASIDELFHLAGQILCSEKINQLIFNNIGLFQDHGLDNISSKQKAEILSNFEPYKNNPMICEIIDWLQGKYLFDPACLT